jgi:VIT1/CCC1 family predicted Fe2+/Mn2+ transporter
VTPYVTSANAADVHEAASAFNFSAVAYCLGGMLGVLLMLFTIRSAVSLPWR